MKNKIIIIVFFVFFFSFGQRNDAKDYQGKIYKEAIIFLKNNELEDATKSFCLVAIYKKNKLSKIARKRADSLIPFAQKSIINKVTGKWILTRSGSNLGYKIESDSLKQRILIIDNKTFSFYDLNAKTNELKLTKSEKIIFSMIRDRIGLQFDFLFSDFTLWNFQVEHQNNTLDQVMIGSIEYKERVQLDCGNQEYKYVKVK